MTQRRLLLISPLLPLFSLLAALSISACNPDGNGDNKDSTPGTGDDTYDAPIDADGDGVSEGDGDCDDSDSAVYPGRIEDCNGVDDNCNGIVDEGWPDTDKDSTADCQDSETCDGLDNDGDGLIDEDFGDEDGDSLPDCLDSEDCDGIDNDGDGLIDEGYDADKDGFTQCGSEFEERDCDDSTAEVNPDATERPGDTIDNDCDGLIDEGGWAESDLLVTEIMNNPLAADDGVGEWFEIYNNSDRTIYLNGLVLSSTLSADYHKITSDTLLEVGPAGMFVLGNNGNPDTNGNVEVGYVYSGISLSNETDDLTIEAGSTLIDSVAWDDGLTMPDPSGASMSLDAWAISPLYADDPASWCAAQSQWTAISDKGTPAFSNDLCPNTDHDHDGYSEEEGDCNDLDDTVYPGAPEIDNTIDHDCDGILNTMPTADATYVEDSATLNTCDALQLDGSGSYDPDGTPLNYTWELTSAPKGSARTTSDILTSTEEMPIFWPDVAGDYSFSLTVDDGDDDSYPSSFTVTISERGYENDPVAVAGDDQSSGQTSTCTTTAYGTSWTCSDCPGDSFTLDGTGSYDIDGDTLTYAWSVVDGSSYGTLSSETSETATFTFNSLAATYGSTSSVSVTLQLNVTDCPGAWAADTITLIFSCTGS